MSRVLYATLTDVRTELKAESTDVSPEGDSWLVDVALPYVSDRIERITGKEFAPRIKTRKFHSFGEHIDDLYDAVYVGPNPLLDLQSVVVGTTTITLANLQFVSDQSPYFMVARKQDAEAFWTSYGTEWLNAIQVGGIWGYRSNYPDEGWLASGQTILNNPLAIGDLIISVTDASGFSVGELLRAEDEFMLITAVSTSPHQLTVLRGVRGSTKTAHNQNTVLERWIVEPQIVRAAQRWAFVLYKMRGVAKTMQVDIFQGTREVFPQDAPAEVWNILEGFQTIRLTSGA